MSLIDLGQKNILTQGENREILGFSGKIGLTLAAFVLSTNFALAYPNNTIGIVKFEDGATAELYKEDDGSYQIRKGNSKNGSDFIYGTTIINGKKYIVYSGSLQDELKVILETDVELYKNYSQKHGEDEAYKLIKSKYNK